MGTQPPTFGAPPPDYGNQGGQVPQAPAPPPTFGAPPPQAPGGAPSFAAPPPQYATPAGSMPPQGGKKGFNWPLTCLIVFILGCCCCCGLPWALLQAGVGPMTELMDGLGDELRRAGIDDSFTQMIEESGGSLDGSDFSTDFGTEGEWGTDTSGASGEAAIGGGVYAGGSEGGRSYEEASTDPTEDSMRIGYWIGDRTIAGDTYTTESDYNTDTGRVAMVWILTTKDGQEIRYTFEYDSTTAAPIPIDDNAHRLAQQLLISRRDG